MENGHLDNLLLAAELVDEHVLPIVDLGQGHMQLPIHDCVHVVWKKFVKALLHNLVHLQ